MKEHQMNEIRNRAEAATNGPWVWDGWYENKEVALCTAHSGKLFVMSFRRWGMQNAQPQFNSAHGLVPASELPVFEVAPDATSRDDPRVYRGTLSGIRHPDAEFIARSRQDVDDLLAHIDELHERIEQLEAGAT